MFYCLHTSSIRIMVMLLVECSNYSNKHRILKHGAYTVNRKPRKHGI